MSHDVAGPRVSIITPAYNTEAYLAETIASVRSQTVSDWEMLVVDDGSTDGTLRIAQAAAARDPRVRVIATTNRGQAAARNIAVGRARGSFIALLDSDDLWLPTFLAEQIAVLDREPGIAIVSGNVRNLGGPGDGRSFWAETTGLRRLGPRDIVMREDAVCVMSVCRRAVFDRLGGFDPRFTGNEDYQLWLRAAVSGFVIAQHFKPLGLYRRRSGSTSSNERRMLRGAIRLLRHAARTYAMAPEISDAIDAQVTTYRRRLIVCGVRDALEIARLLPMARKFRLHRLCPGWSRSRTAWQS